MYIDSKNEGTLNYFVCDFLQDEHGRFTFAKIADFRTDGKPEHAQDWMVSTKLDELRKSRLNADFKN